MFLLSKSCHLPFVRSITIIPLVVPDLVSSTFLTPKNLGLPFYGFHTFEHMRYTYSQRRQHKRDGASERTRIYQTAPSEFRPYNKVNTNNTQIDFASALQQSFLDQARFLCPSLSSFWKIKVSAHRAAQFYKAYPMNQLFSQRNVRTDHNAIRRPCLLRTGQHNSKGEGSENHLRFHNTALFGYHKIHSSVHDDIGFCRGRVQQAEN
ncbi:hypothetical protein Droror1_Dr00016714 [Drosera rotundifolia]